MRYCLLGLTLLLLLALAPAPAAEQPPNIREILEKVRPSVAMLLVESNGKVWDATGFVVVRPSDGKKVLLTNAHILKSAAVEDTVISARLPGMPDPKPCTFLARSTDHDLMMLGLPRGVDPPALKLFGEQNPRRGDDVLLIGNPGGWSWSDYRGSINADPITRAELFKDPELRRKKELRNVVVLRHSIPSYPGMSGAPVLNINGAVVGINLGTMANADEVGFCIHNKHLDDIAQQPRAQSFARREVPRSDVNEILGAEGKVTPHANLRIDGRDLSIGWLHRGYIPSKAAFVVDTYIQDTNRFNNLFPARDLQRILDARQVAHLFNPAIGCQLLVPKGTVYRTTDLPGNLGIEPGRGKKFEFITDDLTVAPEYRTVTMLAIDDPDLYLRALNKAKASRPPADFKLPPSVHEYAVTQANLHLEVQGYVRRAISARVQQLNKSGEKVGTPWGDPDHELFVSRPPSMSLHLNPVLCRWLENYDSATGRDSYSVMALIRGRSMIVLYHKFKTSEREAFFSGKPVSASFRDKLFITGSFGLY